MLSIKSSASTRAFFVIGTLVVCSLCLGAPARAQKLLSSSAWRSVTQAGAIPKHTKVRVRVTEPIDTQTSEGAQFAGVVDKTVYDGNGSVVIPKGSNVVMTVRNHGNDRLVLDLISIETNGEQFGPASETETVSMASVQAAGVSNGGRVLTNGDRILIPENSLVIFRLAEPFQVASR